MNTDKGRLLKALGRNTASNGVFFAVGRGLELVTFAALVRILPLEDYGLLLLASALIGQFAILDGGLSLAVQKFIPQFKAEGRSDDIGRVITATLVFFAGIGLIACVILLGALALDLTRFFGAHNTDNATRIFVAAALLALFEWPIRVLDNCCKGFNLFHELNVVVFIQHFAASLITVGSALAGAGIVWIFVLRWVPRVGGAMGMWLLIQKAHSGPLIVFDRRLPNVFRTMFHYSKWILINQISGTVVNQFDRIIVAIALGVNKVPIYYGLNRIFKSVLQINAVMKSAVVPVASEMHAAHPRETFDELARRGTRTYNALFAPSVALIVIFAAPLLLLMGGAKFVPYTRCLQAALVLLLFSASRGFINSMLLGAGSVVRNQSLMGVLTSSVFLVAMYVGLRFLGVCGGLLAHPVTHFILMPLWMYSVLVKSRSSVSGFLRAVVQGQGVALAAITAFGVVAKLCSSRSTEIAVSIILSVIMVTLAWCYSVDPKLRKRIPSHFCGVFARPGR